MNSAQARWPTVARAGAPTGVAIDDKPDGVLGGCRGGAVGAG